jgi:hypothetical protein
VNRWWKSHEREFSSLNFVNKQDALFHSFIRSRGKVKVVKKYSQSSNNMKEAEKSKIKFYARKLKINFPSSDTFKKLLVSIFCLEENLY